MPRGDQKRFSITHLSWIRAEHDDNLMPHAQKSVVTCLVKRAQVMFFKYEWVIRAGASVFFHPLVELPTSMYPWREYFFQPQAKP